MTDNNNSVFCHICRSGKESYITAICSLSTNNCAFTVKIGYTSIATHAITSYYRIFSYWSDLLCRYAFPAFYSRTYLPQPICFPLAHGYFASILYPILSSCLRISASKSCDWRNKSDSSPVRRVIFASNGSLSSVCAAMPT